VTSEAPAERESGNLSAVIRTPGTYLKLLAPLALCAACGAEDQIPKAPIAAQASVFIGRLEAADSIVGLTVSERGDVYAYVCGGDTTYATHSRWFSGPLSSSSASIKNEGFQLDVILQGDMTDITLTAPDGAVVSTQAERAGAASRSAVYESAIDTDCRWGVVALDDDGADPEVFGTWCGLAAAPDAGDPGATEKIFAQVTPVLPIDFSRASMLVVVNTPAGEQQFEVHRIGAPQAAP
jgi:voltage-gated potassium channel Kch